MNKRNHILIFSLLIIFIFSVSITKVSAHGTGSGWLTSSYVSGNLSLDPISSEWKQAKMFESSALDNVDNQIMSVHNESYVLFLVQRPLNTSIDQAGVLIAFEGIGPNGEDDLWSWVAGVSNSSEPGVQSAGILSNGQLSVVFGRSLNSTVDYGPYFQVGQPNDDYIKMTSWQDGTSINSIDREMLTHSGLELLPYINESPRAPLVYGVIILVAMLLFIVLEVRRYAK